MSTLFVRVVPVYLLLFITLLFLGQANQERLQAERTLRAEREDTRRSVVTLRIEAAGVQGPLAVAEWAQAQGMIPAPEVERVQQVAPLNPPTITAPQVGGLEVRTVWR